MKMMKRKGVSTYISVLLLIVVTIAGGVMIYGYTIGWFGKLGGSGEMGILSVDESSANTTFIKAYIRNVGSSSVVIDNAYVDGNLVDDVDVYVDDTNLATATSIAEGATVTVEITNTGVPGVTYQVRLVGVDNTQLVFSVKAD